VKIEREKLLGILEAVQPGLAKSETVEQSGSFVFRGEDDAGEAVTYNDEMSVSHPLSGLDFEGAVAAEELYKVLRRKKDEEVTLTAKEGELRIKGKKWNCGVKMEAEIRLPIAELEYPGEEDWLDLPEDFIQGVEMCAFTTSTDTTRPVLLCMHLTGDHVESCNNIRLTRYTWKKGVKWEDDLLLPAKAAKLLSAYEPTAVAVVAGWLHFYGKADVFLSCRTMDDQFPDLDKLIDQVEGPEVELPDLGEVIDAAYIFSKGESHEPVKLVIKDKTLTLSGKGEHGWFEEEVALKKASPAPATVSMRATHLKEAIGLLRTVTIGSNMIRLDGENLTHVSMTLLHTD